MASTPRHVLAEGLGGDHPKQPGAVHVADDRLMRSRGLQAGRYDVGQYEPHRGSRAGQDSRAITNGKVARRQVLSSRRGPAPGSRLPFPVIVMMRAPDRALKWLDIGGSFAVTPWDGGRFHLRAGTPFMVGTGPVIYGRDRPS